MTLFLQNPRDFVKSAAISYDEHNDTYWLSVHTFHGGLGKTDWYKSVMAAKRDFGRKFQTGGKWDTKPKA